MYVLGIHDGHDASACLMRDGEIVLGSAEERRRNIKNCSGTPRESIREILKRSGVKPEEIDLVALGCRLRTVAVKSEEGAWYKRAKKLAIGLGRSHWGTTLGQRLLQRISRRKDLLSFLRETGIAAPTITLDHHETHAATAYYHRPWTEHAIILTLDGAGDGLCASVWIGSKRKMERLAWTPKFHSVAAHFYSAMTSHLGMKPYEHEYKVMGMAPYGQAERCVGHLRGLFEVDGLEFKNRSGKIYQGMADLLHCRLRGQRFDNIAAACQMVFEELMLQWVKNAVAATGIGNVCAAGGAFLNVKANKLIRELPEVKNLYVYPAADDSGTSTGAAILGYLQLCDGKMEPRLNLQRDMYLGLEYSDEECRSALAEESGIEYVRMADPAEEIATLLAAGKVVARFAGREEWGPRALGNRSILADPRDMGIIRKLNFAIKHRDFWMPFAASILEEDAAAYIRSPTENAFYMVEAFDTMQPAGEEIVAATHPFDKTVRPQIVNELNGPYRALIRAFKRRTGIGAILNTSFNLHGFPIVGTPHVAVDTLMRSGLDALALGPYLSWRRGSRPPMN
jgi:carbamoyltransferase